MLWLSLYFPHLPLEVFARGTASESPLAIYAARGTRQWVHARNRAAARLGVVPGMSLGAVLSLSTALRAVPRDEPAEQAALESIAAWAGQFTPSLSLQPPHAVLLEILGSLKLFGGLSALHRRIGEGIAELGYRPRLALAPTPLGALLLAQAGHTEPVQDRASLAKALRPLPLNLLELPARSLKALQGLGLATVGDVLALPRAGLARRLGPELLDCLDRALGTRPDPRPPFAPPARFDSRVLLPAEVENSEALLFAARRLVMELAGFLRARGCGVQTLELVLGHYRRPPSRLSVGLLAPSRDPTHLLELLRERLERYTLSAPVEAIGLRAERPVPLAAAEPDLFAAVSARQDWPQLVERLQARLGQEAVHGLCPTPDYRPERAWRYCRPGEQEGQAPETPRPVWLLEQPLPLHDLDKVALLQGPERIESGWWDGGDVARDYFVALGPHWERLWIFRERCQPPRWFVHGVFA